MHSHLTDRQRWMALLLLCMGELMIVLDTTIVNVALPSIRADLAFTETTLVWVVNAYMLTFGGCLLLGGRLGDLYGHRRLFLAGIALFTVASLGCGLARSQTMLVAARAVQGVGGAVVSAVALSLIMNLFTGAAERARAMGVYGFVCAGGGSVGVLLGGVLTSLLSWHWIFLVNLPLGVAIYLACRALLPESAAPAVRQRLDIAGAVTITAALMLAVYAIVGGNEVGWLTVQSLGLLGLSAALLLAFVWIESHVAAPLVPLGLLRQRNLSVSSIIGVLWAAAMFAWFFISALYMQQVLAWSPMQVGMAFLPANLVMAFCSLGLSAWVVMRWGIRGTLAGGLLLGVGSGIALNPLLLAAMGDVAPADSGLASGMVNTAFMMGGALGLAVLASLADARTGALREAGASAQMALNRGYQLAFWVSALCALVAAGLGGFVLRPASPPSAATPSHPGAV